MITLAPLLLLFPTSLAGVLQNPFFEKDVFSGNMLEIPIVEYPNIPGLDALREADHATVAMNANRDILVAFHTSRPDITLAGNMK